MTESAKSSSECKEKSAVSAVVKAHDMLIDLCGPRGWNDTRESWLVRGARKARLSLRRARAIFYQEPIKLTADEYIAIEAAFLTNARLLDVAHAPLEAVERLARQVGVEALESLGAARREGTAEGRAADRAERPGSLPVARQAGR